MSTPSILTLILFVGIAALVDLRTQRIPNAFLVTGLVIALAGHATADGWYGLTDSLIGFLLGLALMLPGWLLRFTGGGDVKLLGAVGAFLGSPAVFYAFALSVFVGAAIAIAYSLFVWAARGAGSPLIRYRTMLTTLIATGRLCYIRPRENEAVGRRFPLAPAIAFGSVAAAVWFS